MCEGWRLLKYQSLELALSVVCYIVVEFNPNFICDGASSNAIFGMKTKTGNETLSLPIDSFISYVHRIKPRLLP
jgi:hypothetical protein